MNPGLQRPHMTSSRFAALCHPTFPCGRRWDGNDDGLIELAKKNALAIGAGHSFIVFLKDAYPGEHMLFGSSWLASARAWLAFGDAGQFRMGGCCLSVKVCAVCSCRSVHTSTEHL